MANAIVKVAMETTPWGDDKVERPLHAVSGAIFYPGAMMALNAGGYAVKGDDTAGNAFAGINAESDRVFSLAGEADGDRFIKIERPWRFTMAIASAALGDEGKALYAVDDNHVGYSSVNSILVGYVDQVISSTLVLVNPLYAPLNPVAVSGNTLAFSGSTGANSITMPDNLANALQVSQGGNVYLKFTTTDGSEVSLLQGPGATASTNVGGSAQVLGGIGGASSGAGGTASVTGGAGTAGNAAGGAVSMVGGAGQGSAAGGAVTITSGAAGATGVAGAVNISVGAATAGAGSAVTITGGNGAGGTAAGGAINLIPGTAVSTGIPGEVQVNSAAGLYEMTWTNGTADAAIPATGKIVTIFQANRAYRVKYISVNEATFGTSETFTFKKDTGTTAPGGGTALCTGAVAMAVSNTRVTGTLVATVATLTLAAGDRISFTIGGTVGSAAGLVVSVGLVPC